MLLASTNIHVHRPATQSFRKERFCLIVQRRCFAYACKYHPPKLSSTTSSSHAAKISGQISRQHATVRSRLSLQGSIRAVPKYKADAFADRKHFESTRTIVLIQILPPTTQCNILVFAPETPQFYQSSSIHDTVVLALPCLLAYPLAMLQQPSSHSLHQCSACRDVEMRKGQTPQ